MRSILSDSFMFTFLFDYVCLCVCYMYVLACYGGRILAICLIAFATNIIFLSPMTSYVKMLLLHIIFLNKTTST